MILGKRKINDRKVETFVKVVALKRAGLKRLIIVHVDEEVV